MAERRNKTSQQRISSISSGNKPEVQTQRQPQQLRDDVGVKVCQHTALHRVSRALQPFTVYRQHFNKRTVLVGARHNRDRISLPSGPQTHIPRLPPASVVVIKHVQHKENIQNVLISLAA